jgi:hypothetical protein
MCRHRRPSVSAQPLPQPALLPRQSAFTPLVSERYATPFRSAAGPHSSHRTPLWSLRVHTYIHIEHFTPFIPDRPSRLGVRSDPVLVLPVGLRWERTPEPVLQRSTARRAGRVRRTADMDGQNANRVTRQRPQLRERAPRPYRGRRPARRHRRRGRAARSHQSERRGPARPVADYEAVADLIEAAEEITRSAADRPSSVEPEDDDQP